MQPIVVDIEESKQACLSCGRAGFDLVHEPGAKELVATAQDRQNQLILGFKIFVHGHLGRPSLCEDAIDAGGVESLLIEELEGCIHKMLASTGCHTTSP